MLLDSLLSTAKPSPKSGGVAKQALFSIAQCVAVLCLAAGDQKCSSTVNMLTELLKDDSSTNSVILYDCFSQSCIIFDYLSDFAEDMPSAKVLFKQLLHFCRKDEFVMKNILCHFEVIFHMYQCVPKDLSD